MSEMQFMLSDIKSNIECKESAEDVGPIGGDVNSFADITTADDISLIDDLRYCQQLLEFYHKYRKCLIKMSESCKCIENLKFKSNLIEFEKHFHIIYDKKRYFDIIFKINNHFQTNCLDLDQLSDQSCDEPFSDHHFSGEDVDQVLADVKPKKTTAVRPERRSKRLNGRRSVKSRRIIRKNLNNKEIINGLRDETFVEVIDSENELISVVRTKENTKTDKEFDFGSIVGFKCNCDDCPFVSYRKDSMRGHLFAKHLKERPFPCSDCEKTFTAKKYLDSHKASVHSIGRTDRLKCVYPNCQYTTQFNSQMSIHISRHKQERSYRCDQCDAGFCSKGDLNVHKKLVHEGSRPYHCDWPGCDAAFKTVSAYNQHKAVHSSDKSFVCDFNDCQMSFTNKERLKRHKESHELVKRHRCYWPSCDRSFSRKYHLASHMKRHTNG